MLNSKILLLTVILAVTFSTISAGTLCRIAAENTENTDSSEVSTFFKNAGCTLEKGAKKVAEGAKSLGETVKEGAKKFGGNVKEKYNELKDKISGNDDITTPMPDDIDIRKEVPLAPFSDMANKCPEGHRIDAKGVCHPIL